MSSRRTVIRSLLNMSAALSVASSRPALSQSPARYPTGDAGQEMLTIFLRHDQSKTLEQIGQQLRASGWYRDFPPAGVEVISWYVMMGIGQVVTLRFAAEKLRDINQLIEKEAWSAYRTEFFATYDYRALFQAERARQP